MLKVHQGGGVPEGRGDPAGHLRLDDRAEEGDRQARRPQHPGDARAGRLRRHLQVLKVPHATRAMLHHGGR